MLTSASGGVLVLSTTRSCCCCSETTGDGARALLVFQRQCLIRRRLSSKRWILHRSAATSSSSSRFIRRRDDDGFRVRATRELLGFDLNPAALGFICVMVVWVIPQTVGISKLDGNEKIARQKNGRVGHRYHDERRQRGLDLSK